MTRPILNYVTYKWECPRNYKACNEDFFDVEGGENYVQCIPNNRDLAKVCPITDIAFEVSSSERDLYEFLEVDGLKNNPSFSDLDQATYDGLPEKKKGIYISKKVMSHGIQQVKLQSAEPCLIDNEYNAAPD